MTNERVLLLSMPFGALERPSLALGLLQAHCKRLGVACDTRYLTISFAEAIGLSDYLWVASDVPYTAFAGDWLFTEDLYGPRPEADKRYVDEVLRGIWQVDDAGVDRLWRIREMVAPFLEQCLAGIAWQDYSLVGLTSIFQQNIASLALARRVKEAHPDITVAFGGANWEETMGAALLRQFPFVDLAFSGEADHSFPEVLTTRAKGEAVDRIPGVLTRSSVPGESDGAAVVVEDLDGVPVPDFDPFFDQMTASATVRPISPTLLVETARGCWWGERSHCTFCGLNGSTMAFRSKSPARVVEEITFLHDRYGAGTFSVVDDILDMRYFRSVLPMLAEANLEAELFWEVKANLTHQQVRQLRDARVTYVQPGIESLNDHVLDLMRKGTTGLRNVQLLKWCKEFGVKPEWNLLYGFPGETAADYAEMTALIGAIWHLDPPSGYGPIRLDRFSPYHDDPAAFGMVNVRPMSPFRYLYPVDDPTLMDIAYYFDFDYADGRGEDTYAREAVELTQAWRQDGRRGMLWMKETADRAVVIVDARRQHAAAPRTARIEGWKAAVYLAADRVHTFEELADLEDVRAHADPEQLAMFLRRCVDHQLMVASGDRWLSVAVSVPAREATSSARLPRRLLSVRAG